MELFARQITTEEADVVVEKDVQAAAKVLVSAIYGIGTKGKNYNGMSRSICVLHSLLLPLLRHSSPVASETSRCKRGGWYFRYQSGWKVAKAILYNERGHLNVCRL